MLMFTGSEAQDMDISFWGQHSTHYSVVTDYHKFSGLKEDKFMFLQFQISEV